MEAQESKKNHFFCHISGINWKSNNKAISNYHFPTCKVF